jgi:CubicO group peptidase (beta-lactamase class C family)
MKAAALAALGALALATGCAQPAARVDAPDLDRLFDQLHATHGFSGAAVVTRQGDVVYSRAVGLADPFEGRPFVPDTRNDGASLAKPFTATLVLMLAREGRLDLDAPVRRLVAEYPDDRTTLRDLLAHEAPLPDYGEGVFEALFRQGEPVTTAAMLLAVRDGSVPARPPAPGRFVYCNLCLDAAALVVERAMGQPFEQVLRARILDPVGMERAFFRPARLADMPPDRAIGYRMRDGKPERFDAEDLEEFYGASNLYASAGEFARFGRAYALGAALPGADVMRVALEPGRPADRTGITLGGWYCAKDRQRCYYTGHHQGFFNVLYWDRTRKLAIAYVSNSTIAPWLQPRIARSLIDAAEGRAVTAPVEPTLATLDAATIAGAAGRHDVAGIGIVTLDPRAGRRSVRIDGGIEYPLYRVSPTQWYSPGVDALVGLTPSGALAWTDLFVDTTGTRLPP